MKSRLQKFIAECGVASRRQAEKLIISGNVRVNGKTIRQLGTKIDPAKDKVIVAGKSLKQKEEKIYIKLNKPYGFLSSCRKYPGEKNILDLIKNVPYRLYPVGRLDKDSEGLIILTNDGELANRLMHPRYQHEKEYEVIVRFQISNDKIVQLSRGIVMNGKKTLPCKIKITGDKRYNIILREGRKRQIRRMLERVGNRVTSLKRVSGY